MQRFVQQWRIVPVLIRIVRDLVLPLTAIFWLSAAVATLPPTPQSNYPALA